MEAGRAQGSGSVQEEVARRSRKGPSMKVQEKVHESCHWGQDGHKVRFHFFIIVTQCHQVYRSHDAGSVRGRSPGAEVSPDRSSKLWANMRLRGGGTGGGTTGPCEEPLPALAGAEESRQRPTREYVMMLLQVLAPAFA